MERIATIGSEQCMPGAAALPPFRHKQVSVNGLTIHYAEVAGTGPPMVMLHGIGMDWRVWQAVSRRLAPYFHLYLLDLRGHGESGKPAHGYTVPHYAADVEDLIDRLELEGVVLVGSSLGGMVAAAVEAPTDVVSHRVLVDPPMTGGPVGDAGTFHDILRLKHQPVPLLAGYLQARNPGAGRFLLRTMSEMWHEAADGVIEDMLDRAAEYWDIRSALAQNEAPTLILRADPALGGVLTAEQAEAVLRELPRGELVTVEGAAHAIHASKPAEFVRLVLEHTGLGAGTGSMTEG